MTGEFQWPQDARSGEGGGIDSVQRIDIARPVVACSERGARELGRRYWAEIARSTHGLVRANERGPELTLVLAGRATLLRFGTPTVVIDGDRVECRYPIHGGLLAARPGGALAVTQCSGSAGYVELAVTGYHPRLDPGPEGGSLGRFLYAGLQYRVHLAISRRFLERAAAEGTP
jgi:hypothetical protein